MEGDSEVSSAYNLDGTGLRVGIKTRWNKLHADKFVYGAKDSLKECNVT